MKSLKKAVASLFTSLSKTKYKRNKRKNTRTKRRKVRHSRNKMIKRGG